MKVVILEDEKPAANMLCSAVADCRPGTIISTVLESVKQAADWFQKNEMPDLVISDIQLLDDNVFLLFKKMTISCPVIFITAYDDYYKQAFDVNGIAYLLKPVTKEDVNAALKKYELLKARFNFQLLKNFADSFPAVSYKQRFAIKSPGGLVLLESNTIAFIRVKDGITWAFSGANKKYLLNETITQLEGLLDPRMFFRINRAEIINIHFIKKLIPNGRDCLTVEVNNSGIVLTSSAGRTAAFRKWLDN
ncbi:MAG: LytTR family DNA-binding domain-containing protein [Bacteroidota bacterium]